MAMPLVSVGPEYGPAEASKPNPGGGMPLCPCSIAPHLLQKRPLIGFSAAHSAQIISTPPDRLATAGIYLLGYPFGRGMSTDALF
jgi:hypothetical protein